MIIKVGGGGKDEGGGWVNGGGVLKCTHVADVSAERRRPK